MAEQTSRFQWISRMGLVGLIAALAALTVALLATISAMVTALLAAETSPWILAVPYAAVILVELAIAAWAVVAYGLVCAMVDARSNIRQTASRLERVESVLSDQAETTRHLVELASLSEQAKSLIFRDRELDRMIEQVHADLMKQDYDAAEVFIDRIETGFGYKSEAARLREEVTAYRQKTQDERIDAAVARFQEILDRHDWDHARREANRAMAMYPSDSRIAGLTERIQKAYAAHKGQLLQAYGEATRKNDIDRGIEILRQLDSYLTPQEAAALEESARDVFRKKLHNLGVQFAISVNDQQWEQAVATGEQIIQEYPNTRMAQEAREKMDRLRTLAGSRQGV
jgi:hypothetical protein